MEDFKTIQFEDINKLKNKKFKSNLARLIVHEPGLVGASIQGRQQTGKSVYAMLVMYELYERDIDKVFENMVFSMDELKEKLKLAIQQKRKIRCILWDDASVHGSASHWMTDPLAVQELAQLGDTMGLATKGFLMTSPSGDLIKAFRQYNFYQIKISLGRQKNDRVSRGYLKGTSPYGQTYFSHVFNDNYDVRLSFYQRYYVLREQLSLSTLNKKPEEKKVEIQKESTQDIVFEYCRDKLAGVTNIPLKTFCLARKINYSTGRYYQALFKAQNYC